MDFFLSTPDEICLEIGARVRKQRQLKNMQQSEVAQKAGLSRKTVMSLENKGVCALDCFIKILYALELEAELESFLVPKIVSLIDLEKQEKTVTRIRHKKL